MITPSKQVGRVLLVRPGATEFDDQGRMKGSLDMPMSENGHEQANDLAEQLGEFELHTIYTAPCESARETASRLARDRENVRIRVIDAFRNVGIGSQILADLNVHDMILLSNANPNVVAIEGYGLNIVDHMPILE